MIRRALLLVGLPLIAGCTGIHGASTGAAQATATPEPSTWASPGQTAIGSIPSSMFNFDGYAFYPAPANANPAVTQAQAEQDAVAGGSLYAGTGQPFIVRSAYLVNEAYRDGSQVLVWVVDTSPDKPYPPLSAGSGAGHPSPSPEATSSATTSGASPASTAGWDHWSWVIVNAQTGAYGVYGG